MSSRRLQIAAVMLGCLWISSTALRGDTIYLKNGATIDCVVIGEQGDVVLVTVGNQGRMTLALRDIDHIERNDRTGPITEKQAPRPAPAPSPPKPDEPRVEAPGTPTLPAPEEPTPPGKEQPELAPEQVREIQDLVFLMGRQDARKRTRAEQQLMARGAVVVPYVLSSTAHPLEWTRTAAFRILKQHAGFESADAALRGLEDESQWVRKLAWETLRKVSGRGFPFPWDEHSTPAQRERARARWETWWTEKQQELRTEAESAAQRNPGERAP